MNSREVWFFRLKGKGLARNAAKQQMRCFVTGNGFITEYCTQNLLLVLWVVGARPS